MAKVFLVEPNEGWQKEIQKRLEGIFGEGSVTLSKGGREALSKVYEMDYDTYVLAGQKPVAHNDQTTPGIELAEEIHERLKIPYERINIISASHDTLEEAKKIGNVGLYYKGPTKLSSEEKSIDELAHDLGKQLLGS